MNAPQNWHKWVLLSLLGLALSARTIGCDYSSITEKFGAEAVARCNEKCPFQNRTGEGQFDVSCGSDCSVQQCKLGCSLWQDGLENSCQIVCNVTSEVVFSRELYCVMGCNEALNSYFQMLRELIGTPTAPALVADSLTATSLSLVWEAPNLGNNSYMVQWRYEELPGAWQYYSNSSHSDQSIIHVDGLRPYTKYRFRVAIFLSGRGGTGEPVYSAPSVVISTLESGKPSSAPKSLRAAAPDSSRIAISWEPGPFPNGPLISYVLRLVDTQPNKSAAVEDMPALNNTLFYMFQNLAPACEYQVSVAMRNAVGEGPSACVTISTPPLLTTGPSQQPILILGEEQNILAAPANDMLSDPAELYSTEHSITGVGLDLSSDTLFVSVSNGYVYRTALSKKSMSEPILTPENISYKPQDLSVDWLNRHLYVLGEVYYAKESFTYWEIIRYDFRGKNEIVAMSGFNSRPIHFEVDPYNGYLFWAQQGGDRGGLYRLDLANISNGVRYGTPPEIIVRDAELGAFTVDHTDFRILVAHLKRNTVWAVSLDGREVNDFRNNTQTPMFRSTRSIAYAGGLFYWTNGKEMLTEEYHAQSDSYFHNEYPLDFNSKSMATKEVLVALRSCQPIPVPVNPPLGLQSVMGINRAKVSWSPPHLLGHQGRGAWQQWTYHLQLTNMVTGTITDIQNINDTTRIVENLDQLTEYTVRVAAVTESGSGPWSSIFVGTTLSSSANNLNSTLLWSGPDGLLQTDLTGENLQILIHRDELKNSHIIDISWYRDKLYLVTNVSTVIWYNITTHKNGLMSNMENVGSLAVDWVGKKIYWSNPKQQLITRGNLDGGDREPVPIVTVAKELTIDSLGAYIYWNTGHAVEAARLNGENKKVYYSAQLYSGKRVMGLTTDLEKNLLYWLVRSYDGSELHVAPTADQISQEISDISFSLVTRIPGTATLGPLCYFSNRLVWVQDGMKAIVSDITGKNTAELVPRVNVVAVRDPSLHADSELFTAIPETINSSSITVNGEWDKFNVTWDPATRVNINNSRVYYDVNLVFYGQHKIEKTVDVNWIEIHESSIAPYSTMEATVRAHTHWGGGTAARTVLHSPEAPPSAPRAPRIYVQPAVSGGPLTAIFRWGSPSRANGVIRGYEVKCWVVGLESSAAAKPSACADAHLSPLHTQLMLKDLSRSSKYFFQVRAYTDAGFGQFSEVVSISSDEINPIPKVMISSQESIKIIDLDSGESEMIPKSTGIPMGFAVSTEENIVYWVNNLEEIFSSRINGSGHFKLLSINGSATSMCLDWVSRSIYWSQSEFTSTEPYVIYRADLGLPNTRPQIARVLSRKQPIDSLQIAPLHGLLLWYEEHGHSGLGTIMSSNVNGSNINSFFKDSTSECNCPENPQVAKPFVIDMTRNNSFELYWVDPWVNHIIATDRDACKCRIVVDATENKKYGFTPMSIAVDSRYVYWFNSTLKAIFYTTKYHKSRIEERKTAYGYKIMTLDPGNQPYPPRHCLFPKIRQLRPKVVSNSANSITLRMPSVAKPDQCHRIEYEMPMTEFTIFYRNQIKSGSIFCDKETCPFVKTTSSEVIMSDLKPFTNYSVLLEATNYYAKLHEHKPIIGVPMTVQTAAEAPTAPKDVTGVVLSPVLAHVEWKPVPGLWYEVHWQTDDSPSSAHKLREHITFEVSEGRSVNLTRLSPNTTYNVRVRARSKHSAAGPDSPPLRLRTYPLPAPLSLKNVTPYEIRVLWPPPTSYQLHQFKVEYTEAIPSIGPWKECSRDERDEWTASELRPKSRYRFRLRLQYVSNAPPYFWPHDDRFSYETLGDVPGPPGTLRVEAVGERMSRVRWTEPDPRGSPVTDYRVWGRPKHRIAHGYKNMTRNISEMLPSNLPIDIDDKIKISIVREGLQLLHNGTDTYWLVSDGSVGTGWVAQVQARNSHGWGPLSAPADLDATPSAPHRPPAAALALALLALLALLFGVAAGVFYAYNSRARKKAALENQIITNAPRRGPDVELATLRQLPTRHSTNIIYNQDVHCPTDEEIASLPHIRREQITLTKFLGSGAFGEVFEGVARQINGSTSDTKVAVKTLRKSATEQEKTEFLKEAKLMSNFKHEHILRLLGVCLDNDPSYIIMELMEGGDLLSYLRAKRASLYTPDSLTLLDLLNMCVDVTKGCRYLEETHYVHRDLACRNCLVAHRANGRVVKIGDFGLARDIYKNDYYRKEGEGLLPVRWMAVECFLDGLFTCQSDVWAWGVLCWEVLSLGQQPYPGRTNRQVLAYVRAGGTPDRPPNCPSAFYDLLQKCWSYSAEKRPSFRHCLEVVTSLRDKTSPNITLTATATPAPHYLTLLGEENKLTYALRMAACSDAVDNRTYLLDENDNACLDEDFPEHQMEPSRLLPERTPKYLELMYDSDSAQGTICDGYEIPRTPLMAPFSRHSIVGVAPNRLIKPPLYRTHSLRTHTRPPNATIIPLRNGIIKRASLCEEMTSREPRASSSRNQLRVDLDFDKHVFKTPF